MKVVLRAEGEVPDEVADVWFKSLEEEVENGLSHELRVPVYMPDGWSYTVALPFTAEDLEMTPTPRPPADPGMSAYDIAMSRRRKDRKGRYKDEVVLRSDGSASGFVYEHDWIPWWRRRSND